MTRLRHSRSPHPAHKEPSQCDQHSRAHWLGSLCAVNALKRMDLQFLAVREQGKLHRDSLQTRPIAADTTLVVRANKAQPLTLKNTVGLLVGHAHATPATLHTSPLIVGQAMVKPSRRRTDGRIGSMVLMRGYGLRVLAAYRPGHTFGPDLQRATLRPADALLLAVVGVAVIAIASMIAVPVFLVARGLDSDEAWGFSMSTSLC